ncbi:MAG: uracil-DNA glycosylase [Chloroflexi bacterium]|nr:MAG: uracil-DNA glycosylase [Chloroflexota bacterium]
MGTSSLSSQESRSPSTNPELELLHTQVLACSRCGLHATRTQAVPGTGPCPADVMVVGEAPGFNEDVQGKPFVGAAGKLLDKLLERIGRGRDTVYITNVLKCRPPQNRDPMRMLPGVGSISRVHGQIFMRGGVAFMPVYHPAAALHNGSLVRDLEQDFDRVRGYLDEVLKPPEPEPLAEPDPEPSAEQLSLLN